MPIDYSVDPPRTPLGCRADTGSGPRFLSYDDVTGTCSVGFPDGSAYQYFNVTKDDAAAFADAEDQGCYFNTVFSRGTGYQRIGKPN